MNSITINMVPIRRHNRIRISKHQPILGTLTTIKDLKIVMVVLVIAVMITGRNKETKTSSLMINKVQVRWLTELHSEIQILQTTINNKKNLRKRGPHSVALISRTRVSLATPNHLPMLAAMVVTQDLR